MKTFLLRNLQSLLKDSLNTNTKQNILLLDYLNYKIYYMDIS